MRCRLSKQELNDVISSQLKDSSNEVVVLSKSNEKDALDVLGDAFKNDPMISWVASVDDDDPDKTNKLLKLSRYMTAFVSNRLIRGERGCALGIRDETSELVGVMAMAPSGCTANIFDFLISISRFGVPPMYKEKAHYGPTSKQRLNLLGKIDAARRENMKETKRWIYLQSIGVKVECQHGGKGYGSKLLRTLNATADFLGVSIYLETESEDLESMYMHFGYNTVEQLKLCVPGDEREDSALTMYLMRRDPRQIEAN
ncbi:hypothetical protein HJC23_013570 [Cyclotella cryptica]|uniref:N-acetyltransferase domain-containing protein n=1 Tax=Cyclotella cryptica TaxID=29204 RepID=A0ABD3PDV8_9STRA|eukprot:CCRYP_015945-RA/>CCRYP_015945-RA protein AED:0.00 eAED:0.00 QI:642/-1/1/1/-1/1/1/314/256